MDDFFELELIELVNKVSSELHNHLGVSDKALAEFLIAQRLESDAFHTFKEKMDSIGGDSFPPSLIESIDRLVRMMHPRMKGRPITEHHERYKQRPVEQKVQAFSGLALPDKAPAWDILEDTFAEPEALDPMNHRDGTHLTTLSGGSKNEHANDRLHNSSPAERQKRRMISPERWELRQLIASGVMKASDYPGLEEDYSTARNSGDDGGLEEDVDIEIREEEPPFLVGQTKQSL